MGFPAQEAFAGKSQKPSARPKSPDDLTDNDGMRKVDFHHHVPDRLRYACSVARTVLKHRLTLAVWSSDAERLRVLDALLWNCSPLVFLPHVRAESPLASETPIRMSENLGALTGDVLLLLDDQLPPTWEKDFERFDHVIDVVSTRPEELALGRERYRAYRRAKVELADYNRQP